MSHSWYSNGKLLLTGEYFVLFGAKALALPVRYGQSLEISEPDNTSSFLFSTWVLDQRWFSGEFETNNFEIKETDSLNIAGYLQNLFRKARELNSGFNSYRVANATSRINFNIHWGMGSSSSLISNVAWWANVNPFDLNRAVSNGSGYDIACARRSSPLFYTLSGGVPVIEPVIFNPFFNDHIWFVYLGKKRLTEKSILPIIQEKRPSSAEIEEISAISEAFIQAASISELMELIDVHEKLTCNFLGEPTIRQSFFSGFKGTIKSLGAWGGDFCMAVSSEPSAYVKGYFEQKGLTTVLPFKEILL